MSRSARAHRGSDFLLGGIPERDGQHWSNEAIRTTLLADIRDTLYEIRSELRTLNGIFRCPVTQAGFRALRSLAKTERASLKARQAAVLTLERMEKRAAKRKAKR